MDTDVTDLGNPMKRLLLCLLAAATLAAHADQVFPKEGWEDQPNPLASPDAVVGGEMSILGHQYPKSFNYFLDLNSFSAQLFGSLYDTLLGMHPLTLDLEPGLARMCTMSDDKKTFTFTMDPKATW